MPTFMQVYNCLVENSGAVVISSSGTEYTVKAYKMKSGNLTIRASPSSGHVYIHEDCREHNKTCQGSWASGIYNGNYSIYDWYRDNCQDIGEKNANS